MELLIRRLEDYYHTRDEETLEEALDNLRGIIQQTPPGLVQEDLIDILGCIQRGADPEEVLDILENILVLS